MKTTKKSARQERLDEMFEAPAAKPGSRRAAKKEEEAPEKEKGRAGRPGYGVAMLTKGFRIPVSVAEEIQRAADREQGAGPGQGNVSLWLRANYKKMLR